MTPSGLINSPNVRRATVRRPLRGRRLLTPLENVSGIGPATAIELRAVGVGSAEHLVSMTTRQLHQIADAVSGLTREGIDSYAQMAQFGMLPEVSESVAADLVNGGYRTFEDIVVLPTSQLSARVPSMGDQTAVARIQLDAARAILTGRVVLRATNAAGRGVQYPRLWLSRHGVGGVRGTSRCNGDQEGWVITPTLRRGTAYEAVLAAKGYRSLNLRLAIADRPIEFTTARLLEGSDSPDIDEFAGGSLGMLNGRDIHVVKKFRSIDELPAPSPMIVGGSSDRNLVALVSLYRRRYGSIVWAATLEIPKGDLPARVRKQDLVYWDQSEWLKVPSKKAKLLMDQRRFGKRP